MSSVPVKSLRVSCGMTRRPTTPASLNEGSSELPGIGVVSGAEETCGEATLGGALVGAAVAVGPGVTRGVAIVTVAAGAAVGAAGVDCVAELQPTRNTPPATASADKREARRSQCTGQPRIRDGSDGAAVARVPGRAKFYP